MNKFQIVSAVEAVLDIKDGDTVVFGGAGAGHAVPDKVMEHLGKRFVETNSPKNLKTIHPCGIGDNDTRGLNHIAFEGLIDTNIGGFWGNAPKMSALAKENKIKGYNLPQGVLSHLMRASASKKPGVITKVGLKTFVDPNEEAVADGIIKILDNPELAEQLGKNAFQLAQEKFGRQDYISKVNQIYNTILPGAKIEKPILSREK